MGWAGSGADERARAVDRRSGLPLRQLAVRDDADQEAHHQERLDAQHDHRAVEGGEVEHGWAFVSYRVGGQASAVLRERPLDREGSGPSWRRMQRDTVRRGSGDMSTSDAAKILRSPPSL